MGHPLTGVDQIAIAPLDPAIIFSHKTVDAKYGPLYVHSGATAIKWAYTLNTQTFATIGGEVTQVLSAFVGPIQIEGITAGLATNQAKTLNPGISKGYQGTNVVTSAGGLASYSNNYTPNHELEAIVKWFIYYLEIAGSTTRGNQRRDETAILFTYPARGWSFYIQITGVQGFRYDKAVISPQWTIQAEVVSDNALNFFSGVTMSSFTDDLVTNYSLFGQIGLSAFANSGTEVNNLAFGQTGGNGSTDPFLNPALSPGFGAAASKMGDNFQQLLGAFAGGTFADFGFGALADNSADLTDNIDTVYKSLFGSTFIGAAPGSVSANQIIGDTGGTTVYNTSEAPNLVGFAAALSDATGLDESVCLAWCNAENGGQFNVLNVSAKSKDVPYSSYSGVPVIGVRGQFSEFQNQADGVTETAYWINNFSNYAGIKASASESPTDQITAIWSSPWDTGHYGGNGVNLINDYNQVLKNVTATNTQVTPPGSPAGGNASALATQLLGHLGKEWIDNSSGAAQLRLVEAGKQLTNPGGLKVSLDPRTMQVVLWLISAGYTVGTSAWCSDHSTDDGGTTGLGGHWGGLCVDINELNGKLVDTDASGPLVLTVDKLLQTAPSPITPRQLISGGYGNVEQASCQAFCIPSASYYGEPTLSEHTNHIHVGY